MDYVLSYVFIHWMKKYPSGKVYHGVYILKDN